MDLLIKIHGVNIKKNHETRFRDSFWYQAMKNPAPNLNFYMGVTQNREFSETRFC